MRYVVAIGVLVLLVAGLIAVKGSQIGSLIKMGKEMEQAGAPPETVATAATKEDAWESTIHAVSTIAAVKGVSLSNDAPGVVTAIRFDSGATVKQGDVLVELDSSVERAQLAAADARRDLAKLNAGRSRALVASESIPPERWCALRSAAHPHDHGGHGGRSLPAHAGHGRRRCGAQLDRYRARGRRTC